MTLDTNCPNCGAPMRAVAERGCLVCDHCSTFRFPEESRDGVRLLGGKSGNLCPVCARELSLGSVLDNMVLCCPNCRGILCSQAAFARVVSLRRALHDGPRLSDRRLNPEELERRIRCPTCNAEMDTYPYHGPGRVVIDACNTCRLIWVDAGELDIIGRS